MSLDEELNSDILMQREPWYDSIPERTINRLFSEQEENTPCENQILHGLSDLFHEETPRKRKRTDSNSKMPVSNNADLLTDFEAEVTSTEAQQFLVLIHCEVDESPKSIQECLEKAFHSAKGALRVGEDPLRSVMRFGVDLARNFYKETKTLTLALDKESKETAEANVSSAAALSERISDTISLKHGHNINEKTLLSKRRRKTQAHEEARVNAE